MRRGSQVALIRRRAARRCGRRIDQTRDDALCCRFRRAVLAAKLDNGMPAPLVEVLQRRADEQYPTLGVLEIEKRTQVAELPALDRRNLRPGCVGAAEANWRVGEDLPARGRNLDDLPPVVAQVVVDLALEVRDAELDRCTVSQANCASASSVSTAVSIASFRGADSSSKK